jgi:autophagy-related protein 101
MRRYALETSVREVLFEIIKFANEKQEHIPPITNTEVVSFPYEITTPRFVP